MAWEPEKLERGKRNEIKVLPNDKLGIYEWKGKVWLHLTDGNVWDVVRLYNVTDEQLKALDDQIGRRLGVVQAPTLETLRELHEVFGQIVGVKPAQAQPTLPPSDPGDSTPDNPPPDEPPAETAETDPEAVAEPSGETGAPIEQPPVALEPLFESGELEPSRVRFPPVNIPAPKPRGRKRKQPRGEVA